MKKLIVLLGLLLPFASFAQGDETRFKKEVKLNVNFWAAEENFSIGNLAPAFTLQNRKQNRHTFELYDFGFSRKVEGELDGYGNEYKNFFHNYTFGVRYKYTQSFLSEKSFSPFLGGGVLAMWNLKTFKSSSELHYPRAWLNTLSAFELVPGIRCRLSKRVGVDVSAVFYVIEYEAKYTEVENPALPLKYWKNWKSELNVKPFEGIYGRVGLYVKL